MISVSRRSMCSSGQADIGCVPPCTQHSKLTMAASLKAGPLIPLTASGRPQLRSSTACFIRVAQAAAGCETVCRQGPVRRGAPV